MKKDDFSWKNNEIKYPESFGKIVAIPISEEKEDAVDDHTMLNNRMMLDNEEIGDVIIDAFKERMRTMLSDHRHNQNH
ncbi:hypothetical protein SAMN04488587_0839 [Methanococcoides vulcani]|uniref:Uncharacterized protein n=1 Tax=Methanococcoides vulcani TaxID=1353158 RepID=A0A1H9Z3N8_9EURY|nr:hypothetical protein [Methanococcoides vulcani]SES76108.1 hypothetical protein SAMN04488587_0839 [Methanococcoides vulcani]